MYKRQGLLRAIKLHAGDDISIELQGQPVALPAHLRRVFAVSGPGNPAVAYEGEVSLLNWDILSLLAPKIGELIGAVETANALETVVTSLARRLGSASLTTPSDADYSAVFEESTDRVAEVRRAHTRRIKEMIDLVSRQLPNWGQPGAHEQAMVTIATMVGTLVLARAVDDEKLSDALRHAALKQLAASPS